MVSSLLLVVMTTSPMQTEGIFFHRGAGCNGTVAAASTGCAGAHIRTRVRAVVETTIRRPVATLLANRPRLFARGGCGGAVAAASTGCSGGVAVAVAQAPPTYQPMPQPEVAGALGHLVTRAAVHRQLKVALRRGHLTPPQKEAVEKVLADPELYSAAVKRVTSDLQARQQATGAVGAIGDGKLLQMLIDSLPQILAFIQELVKLFG